MEKELVFRILLERPPDGVDYGLQKGAGSRYETLQKQRSDGNDLHFEFSLLVKNENDSIPTFMGAFAQGPPAERFVYIDIGTMAGQSESIWSRRLKIPLTGIPLEMIDAMRNDSGLVLEARIVGSGKDGSPSCATHKPKDGWQLQRR